MANTIIKEVLILSEQPPDELVWVAEQIVTQAVEFARLTEEGYAGVIYKLGKLGFNWTATTEFHYTLYYTATGGSYFDSFSGETYILNSGFNVIFLSQFPNGEIPAAMWIPNSWSDTPPNGGEITIPAHYETVTPPPDISYSQNLGWNAGAVSSQAVKGNGYFTFRINDTNTGAVVGLNYASGATYRYDENDITHGIRTLGNQYQVIELGVTKTVAASFTSADIFKIVFTALTVTYYKGVTLIYTSLTALDDKYLKLDCSLYEAGDAVYQAQFMGTDLGTFASLVALQTAHPTSTIDNYAFVTGVGVYVWDGAAWTLSTLEITEDLTVYLDKAESELDILTGMWAENEIIIKTGLAASNELIINTGFQLIATNEIIISTSMTVKAESEFIFKTELQQYNIAQSEIIIKTDLRNPANTIINQIA